MKCRLCKTDAKLCNSHIIPEFMYKVLYDDEKRMYIIPAKEHRSVKVVQKGYTDKLLCEKCENQLSKYERYTKSLLFGGKLPIEKTTAGNEYFEVSRINYAHFKLFLLSILWRASITGLRFFRFVTLGEHEETIRTMILDEQPGSFYQYGCLMSTVESHGELLDIIRMPDELQVDTYVAFRFLMGGFMWVFVVSSDSRLFRQRRLFLQEDGKQIVMKFKVNDLPFLLDEFESFRGKEKDMRYLMNRYGIKPRKYD